MSWHTDNAVKRIFNSFKRLKNQIFEQDIQALQLLNEELINSQKNYVNDNILFAKLLAIHLKCELDYFKDINFAKKNLSNAFNLPLSYHIDELKETLNRIDFEIYSKQIGLNYSNITSKETVLKDKTIIKENQKEIIEKLKNGWNYDKVEKSFYNSANEYLKDINNYN